MTCALRCTKLLTILICILPTQIVCCSYNNDDVITLMAQDPNYRQNPCYIQWKADQDAILNRLVSERDKLERTIAEYNRIKNEASVWKVVGGIAGIIGAIVSCVTCVSFLTREYNAANLQTNVNPGATVADSPILTNNARRDQTTRNVTTINDTYINVPETEGPMLASSWQTGINVPLFSTEVTKTHDSLPSYDDAIKM